MVQKQHAFIEIVFQILNFNFFELAICYTILSHDTEQQQEDDFAQL